MTTTNKSEQTLNNHEKQNTPLKGEVTPAEAKIKATAFAAQAKARMVPKKR